MPIICMGCRYQPVCNYIYDGKCVKLYYERYAERFAAKKQKDIINMPDIRKVIFNYPATVVLWADGTKTVVKCGDYDIYDPEKGLAMAIAKKALGNQGNYYDEFKKWLPEETNIDISEETYEEKDTECDLCEHKEECDLIEITNLYDTRMHLAPDIGNRCKKKEGAPYTVKEFCELLNISKRTAYRMIERGDVKAKKDSKGAWIIFE